MLSKQKRHMCIAVIIAVVFTFSMFATDTSYGEEEKGQTVKVGYFKLEGFNDIDENGNFSGYGYEYLMEIAKYTGWNYEFVYETKEDATRRKHRLTYEEALQMLEAGEIDSVCNVRNTPEPDYCFAAVNKEESQLYSELNSALEDMKATEPELSVELYTKYYGIKEEAGFSLTKEEVEYVKNNPVIRVGVDPYFIPIEYYDHKGQQREKGAFRGITADMLRQISEMTGFKFETVMYSDYEKAMEEKNVQIFSSFASDYQWAEKYNMRLTKAYLKLPVSAVVKGSVKEYTGSKIKVAVADRYFLTEKVKGSVDSDNLVHFSTVEECVEAVKSGEVDVTYVPTYSADYFTSHATRDRIRTYAAPDYNYRLSFGISEGEDVLLYKIINKAIRSIPQNDVDTMVFNNILFNDKKIPPVEFIYNYPVTAILVVCAFWICVIIVVGQYRRLQKKVKREMMLSDERIHIALAQTNMLVWDYDSVNKRIIRTRGSKNWNGMSDQIEDVPECFITSEYVHPECVTEFRNMFEDISKGEKASSGLFKVIKIQENGQWTKEYSWLEIKLTNIFDSDGKPIRAVGLAEDVTIKINEELKLRDKASRDPLTGLLNRTSFQAHVQEFLNKDYNEDLISALILIDTDDFKTANDTYGHFYGDEVLMGIASRLTKCFRTGDFVGRLGGDEFIIFIKNAKSYQAVEEKGKQICNNLVFEKNDLITTCSVGIAIVPNKDADYNLLYKYADKAMYDAKKYGKCRYVIWETIPRNE